MVAGDDLLDETGENTQDCCRGWVKPVPETVERPLAIVCGIDKRRIYTLHPERIDSIRYECGTMSNHIYDYLIEQSGIDWGTVLKPWGWLLPKEFTLWMVNRFADLFVFTDDGAVWMLDVGAGSFMKIAENRDDFCNKMDDDDTANYWLMIPLVDQLVAAGITLASGQCYGLKIPTVLGGKCSMDNCGPLSIKDYLGAYGSMHEQVRDLPDGAQVQLKIVD